MRVAHSGRNEAPDVVDVVWRDFPFWRAQIDDCNFEIFDQLTNVRLCGPALTEHSADGLPLRLPGNLNLSFGNVDGEALLLAMGNLFYRDVKYLFEVAITAWMFGTSVLYPLTGVGGWAGALLKLNPMTPIVDAYRAVLLQGRLPETEPFMVITVVSLTVLVAGWVSFHRAEFQFAENI